MEKTDQPKRLTRADFATIVDQAQNQLKLVTSMQKMYEGEVGKQHEEWLKRAYGILQGMCARQSVEILELLTRQVPEDFVTKKVQDSDDEEDIKVKITSTKLEQVLAAGQSDLVVIDLSSSTLPPSFVTWMKDQ